MPVILQQQCCGRGPPGLLRTQAGSPFLNPRPQGVVPYFLFFLSATVQRGGRKAGWSDSAAVMRLDHCCPHYFELTLHFTCTVPDPPHSHTDTPIKPPIHTPTHSHTVNTLTKHPHALACIKHTPLLPGGAYRWAYKHTCLVHPGGAYKHTCLPHRHTNTQVYKHRHTNTHASH